MKDTIYREDVIKAVAQDLMYKACIQSEYASDELSDWIEVAKVILEEVPSADRPQGEWIYCEDEYGIDGYRCSNCGEHIPWDYQHKFINFIEDYHTCPFCDAKMKGADDE